MLIEAKNISVIYHNKTVLDNISLTIKNNDLITIIGPNGAGKSTLIKCLLEIIKPNSGEIKQAKNLTIGYVPQHINIDKSLPIRVADFIALNKKSNNKDIHNICKEIGILDLLNKNFATLSGGERQKVLLARSMLGNPQLLILDEATSGMDISGQIEFYALVEKLWQKYKVAVVMVSHDLHMVMAKSKKVICLFHHICCSGTPTTVVNNPEFKHIFGDNLQNTLALYNHHHNHEHT